MIGYLILLILLVLLSFYIKDKATNYGYNGTAWFWVSILTNPIITGLVLFFFVQSKTNRDSTNECNEQPQQVKVDKKTYDYKHGVLSREEIIVLLLAIPMFVLMFIFLI